MGALVCATRAAQEVKYNTTDFCVNPRTPRKAGGGDLPELPPNDVVTR